MMISLKLRIPPQPMPWTARLAISIDMLWLAPQRAEPIAKMTMAETRTARRPKICARPPDQGKKATEVRPSARAGRVMKGQHDVAGSEWEARRDEQAEPLRVWKQEEVSV